MSGQAECRVFGHAWDQIPYTGRVLKGEAVIMLRCTRCYKQRRDCVSAFAGILLSRSYVDPEGWNKKPKQTMAEKRLELLAMRRRGRSTA